MYQLNIWFDSVRRPLPWREDPTPYRVWVSEVMLQQTQVRVVIPYFHKWMRTFPTIERLACAPLEHVLKMWEGLGYYSRARSLHKGALYLMQEHGGSIPHERSELLKIPGIGPYTAAALLSFAFQKKALALDGNVLRVLSRYFAYCGDICKMGSKLELEILGERLLDDKEPWKSAEALIELGALVCTKSRPKCEECPLQEQCLGKKVPENFPVRAPRAKTTLLRRVVLVAVANGKYLVQHNQKPGVMRDLFEFPFAEGEYEDELVHFASKLGLDVLEISSLGEVKQSFTRFRATLAPFVVETREKAIAGLEWRSLEELEKRPFSSGHRQILQEVIQSARLTL